MFATALPCALWFPGLISIGDVVKEMMAHQKATIAQLHSYIAG
jgi:hypothetical protein